MHLVMPVLRTVFFVFIVGFSLRVLPFFVGLSRTRDEELARYASAIEILRSGILLALAWILLEVIVGWLAVRRRAAGAPPPASPADASRP